MAGEPDPKQVAVTGTFYRYSNYDVPFWVRANTRSERWNRAGEGPTQYLSSTADGAWAELVRREGLRTPREFGFVSVPMWHAQIEQASVADYSCFEKAEAAGFPPDALVDDDHERCRTEGTRLRSHGFLGVTYPSAALPGEVSLAIFGPRILLPWGAPRVLASGVSAARITIGSPPLDLLGRVRYVGEQHAGFAQFKHEAERDSGRRCDE